MHDIFGHMDDIFERSLFHQYFSFESPCTCINSYNSWWRHIMETLSALLALCEGNPPVTGGFPSQRPVTRSFEVFFDLRPNKRLSKQLRRWWFETPLRSWRHCNTKQCSISVFHCFELSNWSNKSWFSPKYLAELWGPKARVQPERRLCCRNCRMAESNGFATSPQIL